MKTMLVTAGRLCEFIFVIVLLNVALWNSCKLPMKRCKVRIKGSSLKWMIFGHR